MGKLDQITGDVLSGRATLCVQTECRSVHALRSLGSEIEKYYCFGEFPAVAGLVETF